MIKKKSIENIKKRVNPSHIPVVWYTKGEPVEETFESFEKAVQDFLRENNVLPGLFSPVDGQPYFGRCAITGWKGTVEDYYFVTGFDEHRNPQMFKAAVLEAVIPHLYDLARENYLEPEE